MSQKEKKSIYFCQQCKLQNGLVLKLEATEIPLIVVYNFLGITYAKKLSFIRHNKNFRIEYNKTLQLLRVLPRKEWGVSRHKLQKFYRILALSKLDVGCWFKDKPGNSIWEHWIKYTMKEWQFHLGSSLLPLGEACIWRLTKHHTILPQTEILTSQPFI